MHSKRILVISSEFLPNVGGIGNHAYNLSKYLQSNGFQVTVLADIIDIPIDEWNEFVQKQLFQIVPVFRSKNVLATYFERIKKAKQLAKQNEIIITSGKFSLWLNILLPNKKLAIVHGSELDLPQNWAKKLTNIALSVCNYLVAVSNFTASKLHHSITAIVPYSIIHNGINMNEFENISCTKKIIGEPSLITIGSVTERKGQENVIKALPTIVEQFPHAHYHIIGKPVIKEKLFQLAINLNVEKHITFHNQLNRKELMQILCAAHIKLMLSNYTTDGDFEGFGIGIIEANALGKPAIGSNDSGIVDAIDNFKTGILVTNKNANEVNIAIQEIWENYAGYAFQAKEWAKQHDWQIIIQQYISIINSL